MNGVYLIIGGNLGNRAHNIGCCKQQIEKYCGEIFLASNVYETAAWGKEEDAPYLNQVLLIHTSKSAKEILKICLEIEAKLGRIRNEKWESRVIDIDLLFFNDEIISQPRLKIPHPQIQNRKFVLVPLNEIASQIIHPLLHKTISQLLDECKDSLEVKLFKGVLPSI